MTPFAYNTDLTPSQADSEVSREQANARQRRLWDPDPLTQVLSSTEEFQPFYAFSDVDVDRYDVNGKKTQTLTGVRELDSTQLPSNTWTNRHLVYTHGYGVDTARANSHSGDQPDYLLSDIPPTSAAGAPALKQPDVYFGEGLTRLRGGEEQGRRAGSERRDADDPSTRRRRRRREGLRPGAPARVRVAVRRLQPRLLRARSRRTRGSCTCAT